MITQLPLTPLIKRLAPLDDDDIKLRPVMLIFKKQFKSKFN